MTWHTSDNTVVADKIAEFAQLRNDDPEGYQHLGRVYAGKGHWLDLQDKEALPWIKQFARNPWPRKVVWVQTGVTHDRFYWLQLPPGVAQPGQKIVATIRFAAAGGGGSGGDLAGDGDFAAPTIIELEGDIPSGLTLRLSPELGIISAKDPVTVILNKCVVLRAVVPTLASKEQLFNWLVECYDVASTPTATIQIS